jgi:hypothetical protein
MNWRERTVKVSVLLTVLALIFLGWRLGGDATAFLYRPGSVVSDLTITFWPNVSYAQQSLRNHGQLPLWRTLIFSGAPFDADPQSGLWYFPNVVFLLLPAAVGFNLLFGLHITAAGLGMWAWSRATGTSVGGALLAALAYAFTPRSLAHLGFGHVGLFYAAAYVPWVLWAAERLGRGRWRYAGALGLALGWQCIAHPQMALYTGVTAGAYTAAIGLFGQQQVGDGCHRNGRLRFILLGLGLGVTLALMTAAAQLLPMAQFAPLSARITMGLSDAAVSSLPPVYIWGLLLADHRGFMDYMVYVGLLPLMLAGVALCRVRRRQTVFWVVVIAATLVYALGTYTPFYGLTLRLLPILSWLRAPSRVWFLAAAALALLSGWGADRLASGVTRRARRRLNMFLVLLGVTAALLVVGYEIQFGSPPLNFRMLGLWLPLAALLLGFVASARPPRAVGIALLGGLLLADLWTMGATLVEGRPANPIFGDTALAEYLAQRAEAEGPFRVYSPSYSLPRHVAARYGLETVDGVDPLFLEDYAAFVEVASGIPRQAYDVTVPANLSDPALAVTNHQALLDPRLLGVLNVRYVAAAFPLRVEGLQEVARFGATYLYQNAHCLPRAFVAGHVEPAEDLAEALAWLQREDAIDVVPVIGGSRLSSGVLKSEIEWRQRSPNQFVLEVTLDQPGLLVVSQVWYPGWLAEVDGQATALWRANGVLTGLYLSPGKHDVGLTYSPSRWGLVLSFIGVAVCVYLSVMMKVKVNEG